MPTPTPAPRNKKVGPPSDYNGPGYYQYGHRWDEEIFNKPRKVLTWRYFDGEDWIGPEVGGRMVDVYKALVTRGLNPETVRVLSVMFAGSMVIIIIILLLLLYLFTRGSDENETVAPANTAAITQTQPPGSTGESSTVTQAGTTPSAGEPSTVTQSETVPPAGETSTVTQPVSPGSAEVEAAIDLSQNYRLVWRWGDTQGRFDGGISGSSSRWTYTGTSISSWPPSLHAGGGTATCTFQGDPDIDMPQGGWPMNCDLFWEEVTWTGDIRGSLSRVGDGDAVGFEFKGPGNGTDGGDWSPIDVLLTPCPATEVC